MRPGMNEPNSNSTAVELVGTGVHGLDEVLEGGLPADRLYLIEGTAGTGKTTLGLQFLLEGHARGEACLYVTLSESREELDAVAASHGWSLGGVHVLELLISEDALKRESTYTIFEPSEVELSDTVARVLAEVDRVKPVRVVLDSLSEFRLLAQSLLRYRRQTLALKQFFMGRNCTVLLLNDRHPGEADVQLHSIAHGVIVLDQLTAEFGGAKRRLNVVKLRGRTYQSGFHDFVIATGGLAVFPRLVAARHSHRISDGPLLSGVAGIDALMGGGIDRGTGTMLVGPAGSGKSTLALQYAVAAAARGERAAAYLFDERPHTLLKRLDGLNIPLRKYVESGHVTIRQIDPAEFSPGELASIIQAAVEPPSGDGARVVVIDSLNGYVQSMPEERFLNVQLHELLTYLAQLGVVTFLIVAQPGLVGTNLQAPFDASYLVDAVVLLRHFESNGRIHQAISTIKRRTGPHERMLREFGFNESGIVVGEPLIEYQGVLNGSAIDGATFPAVALRGQPP